jgi:hypothetical protein
MFLKEFTFFMISLVIGVILMLLKYGRF